MGWRSVVITRPAKLSLKSGSLVITQNGDVARVPLEDMGVVVLDHSEIELNTALLSALAEEGVTTLTVGRSHMPNGALLPYLPHSRALKVMTAQLGLSLPEKKRLWQRIVQFKTLNQAETLSGLGNEERAARLRKFSSGVRSGDPDNVEATVAAIYFRAMFGSDFCRSQDRFYNSALNYGYAVIRATIARSLVAHGFLPAFGIFHHNEQDSFNLADDLIEPYRPLLDAHVMSRYGDEPQRKLEPDDKGYLVAALHMDVFLSSHTGEGCCTLLSSVDTMVAGLSAIVLKGASHDRLALPLSGRGSDDKSA